MTSIHFTEMKLLFLTCWYPSEENPLKGIFIKEHAKTIALSGNEIFILFLNVTSGQKMWERSFSEFIDENGIKTHVVTVRSRFYKWIYINHYLLYFLVQQHFKKQILHSFQPDIIHSNVISPAGVIGYWLSRKYALPHVITEHWSKVDNFMRKNFFSYSARKAYETAKNISVVSDFLKHNVSKYVKQTDKIKIIPNAIDSGLFTYVPKVKSKEIVFTAVASWTPPKAPHFFTEALREVQKSAHEKFVLNIIGKGPLLENIKNNGFNYQINFLGNRSKREVAAVLKQSHYFLHASYIETFSIVVAEALSTGTPVLASKVGALPELVHKNNGVLCSNTPDEWTKGILALLQINFDNKRISTEAHEKFNSAAIGTLFDSLYRFR